MRGLPKSLISFLLSVVTTQTSNPTDNPVLIETKSAPATAKEPKRTPAFPISKLPGGLPKAHVPEDADLDAVAQIALKLVEDLKADNLIEDALWRDLFTVTGTARTFHTNKTIASAWNEVAKLHQPHNFQIAPGSATVMRPGPGISWVQVKYSFRTSARPIVNGKGIIRVVPNADGQWKIWLLISMLDNIPGLPSADVMAPRVTPGPNTITPTASPRSSVELRTSFERPVTPATSEQGEDADYDCVVVGGGPSGLCLAGHLQALNMRYAVLDKNSTVAGNWTSRYDSVNIHTSRNYGQLPFGRVWGPETPYHLKVKDLERGYQQYVKENDINLMLSTNAEKAYFDPATQIWTLQIRTQGNLIYMRTRHLVMALGAGGQIPKMPSFANQSSFRGELLHSGSYKSSKQWAGKRGVVIGSANTAHDICNDMLGAGLSSITMVQRGRTPVIPVQCWSGIYDPIYKDDVPVSQADSMMIPLPTVLQRAMNMRAVKKYSDEHPELFDGLEKAGFKVERYMDLYHCLYERFGGHYVDVGVSQKIADGEIKMKSDSAIKSFTETGLLFEDGSTVDADVIIFATGFEGNMRTAAEEIVGKEIGEQLDDWWGVDKEGELRGAWKPIGRTYRYSGAKVIQRANNVIDPNIWFTGGNLGLARFYARYLALQMKCEVSGFPLKVYEKTPETE